MNLKFENGDSAKREELRNLLRTYNRSKREPSESQALDIYLEDEEGNLIAGLTGETFGNWLEIEYLFVKEDLRGQGIGSKILDQAEKEALVRNCTYSFVNTYQFQAPDFYKKHGYQEVFTLKEYPYSGKRYYFTKDLEPEN